MRHASQSSVSHSLSQLANRRFDARHGIDTGLEFPRLFPGSIRTRTSADTGDFRVPNPRIVLRAESVKVRGFRAFLCSNHEGRALPRCFPQSSIEFPAGRDLGTRSSSIRGGEFFTTCKIINSSTMGCSEVGEFAD